MTIITEQALARKQRFLQLKQEVGGAGAISDYIKTISNKIWFNDAGDIQSISKEHNTSMTDKYKVAEFTDDQISILKDKSWNLYRVEEDKNCAGVYYISVKPQEMSQYQATEFLTVIPKSKGEYDVKVQVKENSITISLSKDAKKLYKNVPIHDAVIKGKRQLVFYLTTIDDPSFLLETISVKLSTLIQKTKVSIKTNTAGSGISVYTIKLFENYVRE
jgi:hypothetical protein